MAEDIIRPTPGTPGYDANKAIERLFPTVSTQDPWIVLLTCKKGVNCPGENKETIDSDAAKSIFQDLESAVGLTPYATTFTMMVNYYSFSGDLTPLRETFINSDQSAMFALFNCDLTKEQNTRFSAYRFIREEMKELRNKYCPQCEIGMTGMDCLGDDTISMIAKTIFHADLITIPIALLIFAYMVSNWRYVFITLFNLGTVIFVSFAIMVYISKASFPPQGVTPQFVEVMAMALTIDYSLFFFTRFVSELERKRAARRKARDNLKRPSSKLDVTLPMVASAAPAYYGATAATEAFTSSPKTTNRFYASHQQLQHDQQALVGRSPRSAAAIIGLSNVTSSPIVAPTDRPGEYFARQGYPVRLIGGPLSDEDLTELTGESNAPERDEELVNFESEYLHTDEPLVPIVRAAIYSTVSNSGHVIFVSGTTLLISFCGFFIADCPFLSQPAAANVIMIFFAMLVAITSTPAFIFAFPSFFTDFNLFPAWMYKCCCSRRRRPMLGDVDVTGDEVEADALARAEAAVAKATAASNYYGRPGSESHTRAVEDPLRQKNSVLRDEPDDEITTYARTRRNNNERTPLSAPLSSDGELDTPSYTKMSKSWWFKIGNCLTRFPVNLIMVLLLIGASAGIGYFALDMDFSTNLEMGVPRESPSLATLKKVSEEFSPGMILPFDGILESTVPDAVLNGTDPVLNDDFFNAAWELYEAIRNSHPAFKDTDFSTPVFFNGTRVTADEAKQLLDADNGNTVYKVLWTQQVAQVDGQNRAMLIAVNAPFDPQTDEVKTFIKTIRKNIDATTFDKADFVPYFHGYKVYEYDTIEYTSGKFGLMLGVTTALVMVVVAVLLKSAFVPVRLTVTLIVPLAAVYGLAVLVYQHGILNWLHVDAVSNKAPGFYWDIPVFAFVVLLGLALDYDVFIITRIIEYRAAGYTNDAAIVMALYETGPVISAAGAIMAISFCSLMIMNSPAVQQTGWILVTSVILDTLVVRSILVPCVMSFADKIGWWPRKVPYNNLKNADGTPALEIHASNVDQAHAGY